MPGFLAVVANAGGGAGVAAVQSRTLLPVAAVERGFADRLVRSEPMVRDEPGHGVVVPGGQECGFCDLVVALGEEGAEADLGAATAPAGARRHEPGAFRSSHVLMVAFLENYF